MPKGAVMHGAPRSLEAAPCLEGSKTVNIWYTPRVEDGSPENEDGFEKFGNLRSLLEYVHFLR